MLLVLQASYLVQMSKLERRSVQLRSTWRTNSS
jgi:hypothetical protein